MLSSQKRIRIQFFLTFFKKQKKPSSLTKLDGFLIIDGGADGTRTRDLQRDRLAF